MKKKIVSLCLVVAMLAIAIIGGSLAYFTDEDEAVNTFTVGNVDIDLDEPAWDESAKHNFMPGTTFEKDPTITVVSPSEDCWVFMEVQMNKFNSWLRLLAVDNDSDELNLFEYGQKDGRPCGCNDCQGHLVRAGLEELISTSAYQGLLDQWFGGVHHDEWKIMNLDEVCESIVASWSDPSIKVIQPVFGYKTVLKAGESATLFTTITMPGTIDSDELADSRFNTDQKDWELTITAYGIQAANLNTLDAAYSALVAENAD